MFFDGTVANNWSEACCPVALCRTGRDLWEIDYRAGHVVDVVQEYVEHDVGNGLYDFAIRQAGGARALEVRVFHFAALDDDASHEFQDRVCLARSGSGANSVGYVFLSEADLASDKRVRAQAIAAQVAFGDGEGDLLADPGIESSISEYAAEIEKPFERHRRIAQHAEDVRHKTKFRHHIIEQSLGRTRRVFWIKLHDAIHILRFTHTLRFSDAPLAPLH